MSTTTAAIVSSVMMLAATLGAQCIGDDNMVGPPGVPCCFSTTPLLPSFPALPIASQRACLLSCGVENQSPLPAFFTAPTPLFCDLFVSQIFLGPPLPAAGSLVVMKYSRTWMENSSNGPRQVWRFLINTDIVFAAGGAGASPCPMPPCAQVTITPARPVHFIGNFDYAYECNTNSWGAWFTLVHYCGYFMHGPSSQRPLPAALSHNDRMYAIAGPVPFTFGATTFPFGFMSADSQRTTDIDLNAIPLLWDCKRENAIAGSLCGSVTAFCPCAPTSTTSGPLWGGFAIGWSVICNANALSSLVPVTMNPYLPTGMGILGLGTFSGPAGAFPGTREVEAWIGLASGPDPCGTTFSLPFHIVTGTSHHSGDPGTTFPNDSFISVTTDRFFDFQNMLIPNPSAPGGMQMGIGSLFGSSQVWGVCLL